MRVPEGFGTLASGARAIVFLGLGPLVFDPVSAQDSASPYTGLPDCLEVAETPGRSSDQACARQAVAACNALGEPQAISACQTALACRFLEEGRGLAKLSGNRAERPGAFLRDWSQISARCASFGADAEDCRRQNAREWWISARGGARLAGVDLAGVDLAGVDLAGWN